MYCKFCYFAALGDLMKKILFRQIGIAFLVITFLLFGGVSFYEFHSQRARCFAESNDMLDEVIKSYESSLVTIDELIASFEDDYINRAKAIDYMLLNDADSSNIDNELKKLQSFMEVLSIHLVDDSGIIQASSNDESIGLDLKAHAETSEFWDLIQNPDSNATAIDMNTRSLLSNEPRIYIAIKSSLPNYSILQIGVNPSALADVIKSSTIQTIIAQMPTLPTKAAFVVNKATGKLESITRNNDQEVNIRNAETPEKFVKVLENCTNGKLVYINNELRYLTTRDYGDTILAAYVDADLVYRTAWTQLFYAFIVITLVSLAMLITLYYHINEYVIKDIQSISKNVQQMLLGNYHVTFSSKHKTEFSSISGLLNDWKASYKNKTERMSHIVESVAANVGAFECLQSIHQNFFSDNMQQLLNVDDMIWQTISKSEDSFRLYIDSLINSCTQGEYIYANDQFLKISAFKQDDAYYGTITNCTKEVLESRKMQAEAETDSLTSVLNRAGFRKRIELQLAEKTNEGILLIFDLDSFKAVNDTYGHPEGDRILTEFAEILKSSFRSNDIIGRMGGDEFVVFIPMNLTSVTLVSKLNHILSQVRLRFSDYHNAVGLSASIGAVYVNESVKTFKSLYKYADTALYIAKNSGKNGFYINLEHIECTPDKCALCTKECENRKRYTQKEKEYFDSDSSNWNDYII